MLKIEKMLYVSEEEKRGVCKVFGITLEEFWELQRKVHEFIDQSEHLPQQYDIAMVWGSLLNNKANLSAAKTLIENYYRIKNVYADILFDDCIPSSPSFMESHRSTINVCSTKLTPDFARVHILKYTDPDGAVKNINTYLINLCMLCEIRGRFEFSASTIVVVDLQELTYKSLAKHSMQYILIVKDIMHSIHIRIQAIHYINGPSLFETFLTIIKGALPAKLKERIHIHKDEESLLKAVPKECLPSDYGGTDKSLKELHEDWIEAMIELEPFFQKLRKAKSTKKYEFDEKTKDNLGLGIEGTFKKLEID